MFFDRYLVLVFHRLLSGMLHRRFLGAQVLSRLGRSSGKGQHSPNHRIEMRPLTLRSLLTWLLFVDFDPYAPGFGLLNQRRCLALCNVHGIAPVPSYLSRMLYSITTPKGTRTTHRGTVLRDGNVPSTLPPLFRLDNELYDVAGVYA